MVPKGSNMIEIELVDTALAEVFGRYSERWMPSDPLVKLIERILGQRTTHAHVRRAMENLAAHGGGWASIAALSHDLLADLIRPAGLAQQKAGAIHGILQRVYLETGEYSLQCLTAMDTRTATRFLRSLPGVGAHTAALVLVFALGRHGVMPVESHLQRVARRLGWAAPDATLNAVQQAIEGAAPDRNLMDLHVNLIDLGQAQCRPGTPDCPNCPLNELCATARLQPWW